MRIISGKFRSRILKAPKGNKTRPTSDRVKEGIFNTISGKIENAIVLDLFAGSGNLSFEALSRGARFSYLVEKEKDAYYTIMENAKKLDILQSIEVYNTYAENYLRAAAKNGIKFDLIFLDPPYYGKYYDRILEMISSEDLLSENGVIIVEAPKDMEEKDFISSRYEIVKEARYGDTKIFYFQKTGV